MSDNLLLYTGQWWDSIQVTRSAAELHKHKDLQPEQKTLQEYGMWQEVSGMSQVYVRGIILKLFMELCFHTPWIRSCRAVWHLLNYARRPLQRWIQTTCQAHKFYSKTKAEFTSEGWYSTWPTDPFYCHSSYVGMAWHLSPLGTPHPVGGSSSSSKKKSPSHFRELNLKKGELEFCLRSYEAEFIL